MAPAPAAAARSVATAAAGPVIESRWYSQSVCGRKWRAACRFGRRFSRDHRRRVGRRRRWRGCGQGDREGCWWVPGGAGLRRRRPHRRYAGWRVLDAGRWRGRRARMRRSASVPRRLGSIVPQRSILRNTGPNTADPDRLERVACRFVQIRTLSRRKREHSPNISSGPKRGRGWQVSTGGTI